MSSSAESIYSLSCAIDNLSKAISKDMNGALKKDVEGSIARVLSLVDKIVEEEMIDDGE